MKCVYVCMYFYTSVILCLGTTHLMFHHLPFSGLYCFLMTVIDRAGNRERTRRFVMFDDTHLVSISQHPEDKIWVPSAAENTSHAWLRTLQAQDYTGEKVKEISMLGGLSI